MRIVPMHRPSTLLRAMIRMLCPTARLIPTCHSLRSFDNHHGGANKQAQGLPNRGRNARLVSAQHCSASTAHVQLQWQPQKWHAGRLPLLLQIAQAAPTCATSVDSSTVSQLQKKYPPWRRPPIRSAIEGAAGGGW